MSAIKPAIEIIASIPRPVPIPVFGTPGIVPVSVSPGMVVPCAVTATEPDVEAGRPFGPVPPAATPTAVTDPPDDALVAITEPGVIEIEKVLPTAVAGCTSQVSANMYAAPAGTNSGLIKLNDVAVPFATTVTFDSEESGFAVLRTLQSERFATEPFELALIMSGIDVTLKLAPVAPTEMLASATSFEPAGTVGAVSRFTRKTGPIDAAPALTVKIDPLATLLATLHRRESVVVPVDEFTASGELKVNVFVPETVFTIPLLVSDTFWLL